jgi:uncharacterized membrane protein (UPF0127 family)
MRKDTIVSIYRADHQCLLPRVKVAQRFGTRWRGLMFYPQMPGIDGMLLYPCNCVHMFWMRFSLSLIYLDRDGCILKMVEQIVPNRFGPLVKDAYYVLEARPGLPGQRQLTRGQRLTCLPFFGKFEV